MIYIRFLYIVTILTTLLLVACTDSIIKDLYPNFSVPILEGATNINTFENQNLISKDTHYILSKLESPEVIFEKFNFEFKKYKLLENTKLVFPELNLVNNTISTGDWQKEPAIYTKGWVDEDKLIIVKVTLTYTFDKKIKVNCFIHPYLDSTLMSNFHNFLDKEGKTEEFYQLINKYGKKNGDFNHTLAIKENPNSEILKTYVQFVEDNFSVIKENYTKYTNKN